MEYNRSKRNKCNYCGHPIGYQDRIYVADYPAKEECNIYCSKYCRDMGMKEYPQIADKKRKYGKGIRKE